MSTKRPDNDGTIRHRTDGRWEARYYVGNDSLGKPIRRSIYASSQSEVQSRLREVLTQIEKGSYVEPSNMTITQWLETWFNAYGKPRWREKTAEVHSDNIRLHVGPALGKINLLKLRPDHIQTFINQQSEKGFSPATIHKQIEPLKSSLKQAVDNHLIFKNPAEKIKLPQLDSKEIDFLSIDEQRTLLSGLPDTTAGRAIKFTLFTGLRASELCGLRWSDIEKNSFMIRQSAQYVRNTNNVSPRTKQSLSVAPPKTKAGRRNIPLTSTMKTLLEQQRKSQITARLAAGNLWTADSAGSGDCPVFASAVGTVYDRNNIARVLRSTLLKLGLRTRGIHALRHTFATNWVRASGDLKTLSEILGHTKVSFTMQLYVHSDMNTKLAGMQAIENMI